MFDKEDGTIAVRMARLNIEKRLGQKDAKIPQPPVSFKSESGVFVTLKTFPENDLRGCIGYVEPIMSLEDALMDVSISAALRDPRFPPVRLSEMDSIVVEVTLLTPPEVIDYKTPEDLVMKVTIGKDGLIAKRSYLTGLLLPQVPLEWNWSVEEFLSHTCLKAGMHEDAWKRGDVEFKKFSGMVFGEKTPRGDIEELPLG